MKAHLRAVCLTVWSARGSSVINAPKTQSRVKNAKPITSVRGALTGTGFLCNPMVCCRGIRVGDLRAKTGKFKLADCQHCGNFIPARHATCDPFRALEDYRVSNDGFAWCDWSEYDASAESSWNRKKRCSKLVCIKMKLRIGRCRS